MKINRHISPEQDTNEHRDDPMHILHKTPRESKEADEKHDRVKGRKTIKIKICKKSD